jgi:hypothetical protein
MTKEETLAKELGCQDYDLPGEIFCYHTKERGVKDFISILKVMDMWAKQESIEFFKWNALKVDGYIKYIDQIKPLVTSNEIEMALSIFEGSTLEERYELYQQSKQQTP